MTYDVNCPYCEAEQDINHDDGYGYKEGEKHQQECSECRKTFVFETSISFYYEAEKADCLNGAEHQMKSVLHTPNVFPDWKRCTVCDKEERGKYVAENYDTPQGNERE